MTITVTFWVLLSGTWCNMGTPGCVFEVEKFDTKARCEAARFAYPDIPSSQCVPLSVTVPKPRKP